MACILIIKRIIKSQKVAFCLDISDIPQIRILVSSLYDCVHKIINQFKLNLNWAAANRKQLVLIKKTKHWLEYSSTGSKNPTCFVKILLAIS